MTGIPLRILILEDRAADAQLCVRELTKAGYDVDWTRVETGAAFEQALSPALDAILVDIRLPGYSGIEALAQVRRRDLDVPCIVVTGAITEEQAVGTLTAGAVDYVLKDRMARLAPAVARAIKERADAALRRRTEAELRKSDTRLRAVLRNVRDVIWSMDAERQAFVYVSHGIEALTGHTETEFMADPALWMAIVHPDDRARAALDAQKAASTGSVTSELRLVHRDGSTRHVLVRAWMAPPEPGQPPRLEGVLTDLTERMVAAEERQRAEATERERSKAQRAYRDLLEHPLPGQVHVPEPARLDESLTVGGAAERGEPRPPGRRRGLQVALLALAIASAAVGGAAAAALLSAQAEEARYSEAVLLGEAVRYEDEVLTMSARMYAVTGNASWVERYWTHAASLNDTLERLRSLEPNPDYLALVASTSTSNDVLIGLEMEAFRLTLEGEGQAAFDLLNGATYTRQKEVYASSNDRAQQHLEAGLLANARDGQTAFGALSGAFGVVILSAGGVGVALSRRLRREQQAHVVALQGESARLEAAVERRTSQARKEAERAAVALQAMDLSQSAARLGTWQHDHKAGRLNGSKEHFKLFGLDPAGSWSPEDVLAKVHPEDAKAWQAAMEESIARQGAFRTQCRVPMGNGDVRWVEVAAHHLYDPGAQVRLSLGTSQDITERVAAEAKAKEAEAATLRAKALEDAERERSVFVNAMAHELNNPLTPLQLQVAILGRTPLTEAQRKSVGMMDRNLHRMGDLVRDLLDVARIQAKQLRIEAKPTDIGTLCEDAAASYGPQFANAHVTLRLDGGHGKANVDPGRIMQVLGNLLSNAAKFSPAGTTVTLSCRATGAEVEVTIADQGPGLSKEQTDNLFKPFSQVLGDQQRGKGGLGLGLYISKGIVERHGGRIWAESAGPGQGASFRFVLPVSGADGVRASEPAVALTGPPSNTRPGGVIGQEQANAPDAASPTPGARVLGGLT